MNVKGLNKKLSKYDDTLQKYENAFLNNDGVINQEEQETLDSIRAIIVEIQNKLNKASSKTDNAQVPANFEKGLAQVSAAVKKLNTQIESLKKANKLDKVKHKVIAHIGKIKTSLPKLSAMFQHCALPIKEDCAKQIDSQNQTLQGLEDLANGKESLLDKVVKAISPVLKKWEDFESLGEMLNSYDQQFLKYQKHPQLKKIFAK